MRDYMFMISVLVALVFAICIITFSKFKLSNEQYDRLKAIVLKWPAILTLLGVFVATFNFVYGKETITIVAAIGAFLERCLGVSNQRYSEGAVFEGEDWIEDLEDGDVDE